MGELYTKRIKNIFRRGARCRTGMTLIELLVVISIIGILMAILVPAVSKMREHGFAAQCENNLRNLAHATINYANDNDGWLPRARPSEGRDALSGTYYEKAAWVNWIDEDGNERGPWEEGGGRNYSRSPWTSEQSQRDTMEMPVWWGEKGELAIREGQLWPFLNRDLGAYLCPQFYAEVRGVSPGVPKRSYVMNAWFGGDRRLQWLQTRNHKEPSRLLLFADMQPERSVNEENVCHDPCLSATDVDSSNDGKLDYGEESDTLPTESIGILHRGRANVVFVDGHVESIDVLEEVDEQGQLQFGRAPSLTWRLCNGTR